MIKWILMRCTRWKTRKVSNCQSFLCDALESSFKDTDQTDHIWKADHQAIVHYVSLLVISSFSSPKTMAKRCIVCSHTVKRESGEIQDFVAQIVMFNYVVPTVLKHITFWKLSYIQILMNLPKINHFWKVDKLVVFTKNKPVLKGLKLSWNSPNVVTT